MALNTTTGAGLLVPESVGALIIEPLKNASTAMAVATNVTTQSGSFRIPIVVSDAAGGWYPESGEISLTDAEISRSMWFQRS